MRSAVAAVAAAAALIGAFYGIGAAHPPAREVPQGDEVGAERGETPDEYARRCRQSLEAAGDEPAFALVTFDAPVGPAEAAEATAPVARASAVVAGSIVVTPVPTAGHTRADVFARAAGDAPVRSVVVYADGGALREVAAEAHVATVEVLPPDAVWGAFAIRA